jgi:glutathione S-transferase
MNYIYHIVLPDSWDAQLNADTYRHDSLAAEGFIHMSYLHQIEPVLQRYYTGVSKVLILKINPDLLATPIVVEASTAGELYPHLYAVLNKTAIESIEERLLT